MKDRIKQLLQHLGVSAAEFADRIGVQRSAVSHILAGRNNPGLEFLQKVLMSYPEINPDWLLLGNGNIDRERTPAIGKILTQPIPDLKEWIEEDDYNSNKDNKIDSGNIPATTSSPEKIIELYPDGTFRIYTSRKT